MCALVERWMDTTHTFHLPFGEMTITSLDFATITDMSFSEEPIPLSNKAYSFAVVRNVWLRDLFRATAFMKSSCVSFVRYTQLVDKVRSAYNAGHVSSK